MEDQWEFSSNRWGGGAVIKDNIAVLKARPGTGSQPRALKGSGDSQQGWKCTVWMFGGGLYG